MRYLLLTTCAALLLITSTLASRPLLPVDETRYLSVAWEAYATGDHLVSHLNSETYTHKPPLLFWFINAVWYVTGLNEYAARLVSPVVSVVCLLLTAVLARQLWPETASLHRCAPMVLASIILWIVFCPLTMFDMFLTCCTLLALHGVLRAESGANVTGWLIAGIGMGFGILAKGPVVLVHVMPAALLAPLWSRRIRTSSLRWYFGCIFAVIVAAAIGLSWALPSAAAGGEAYGNELLVAQTAGRIVSSFAHRHPFWWYIPVLPLCLLPWISLGTTWRGLRMTRLDAAMKFLMCWAIPSLLILSLVSGKQIHYLLPVVPAFALILARILTAVEGQVAKHDLAFTIFGTVCLGVLPLIANHISLPSLAGFRGLVADWYALPLMACGALLIPLTFRRIEGMVFAVGTFTILFAIISIASVRLTIWRGFELRPMAETLAGHNGGIAWYGLYEGQLNYLGGIRHVQEIRSSEDLSKWLAGHRNSVLIKELSAANLAAMKIAEIDASNIALSPSMQFKKISQVLRADAKFPGHEWQPTVTQLYWIRPRFPVRPHVVVRFENPPGSRN
ncbi:MAG: glycosyltransferase family 39 protein [Planctomycetota bacterium]|nr:glycosyltransferase family 39 protein [Planctomycetota bacterium]